LRPPVDGSTIATNNSAGATRIAIICNFAIQLTSIPLDAGEFADISVSASVASG
jgi:hypothetical protein